MEGIRATGELPVGEVPVLLCSALPCPALLCHALPCSTLLPPALPSPAWLPCHAHALSCSAMPCLVLPFPALPCLVLLCSAPPPPRPAQCPVPSVLTGWIRSKAPVRCLYSTKSGGVGGGRYSACLTSEGQFHHASTNVCKRQLSYRPVGFHTIRIQRSGRYETKDNGQYIQNQEEKKMNVSNTLHCPTP